VDNTQFMTLFWITMVTFLGPTIGAMIWAGAHHWDVGEGTAHPT
jgi:hypothetical protein